MCSARNKSAAIARSIKRGQSTAGRHAAGISPQASGLLLSLDLDGMSSDVIGSKQSQAASKSKQEALLQSLEQKKWGNMEEFAVRPA